MIEKGFVYLGISLYIMSIRFECMYLLGVSSSLFLGISLGAFTQFFRELSIEKRRQKFVQEYITQITKGKNNVK